MTASFFKSQHLYNYYLLFLLKNQFSILRVHPFDEYLSELTIFHWIHFVLYKFYGASYLHHIPIFAQLNSHSPKVSTDFEISYRS